MSAIPGNVDTDAGPPMTVPLRHFVVALAFLVAGVAVGVAGGRGGHLAQVHLLLAGWVCLTIMGAMTQFVPVWSGVALHSRRLAAAQLPLAAVGFAGLAGGLLFGVTAVLPVAGVFAVAGVWTFVYTIGRTLADAEWDVTTAHFAAALGFFVLVTSAGVVLALDHAVGVLPMVGVTRADLLSAHATLAVFGAVLTTVAGALAQLAPMFTQTDATRVGGLLQRAETVGYPLGVLLLAGGRLLGIPALARVGGVLVAGGLAVVGLLLARRLLAASVERTPMLTRYAVVAVTLVVWAPLSAWAWWQDPIAYGSLFGHPAVGTLLLVGGVGFVVLGTLYHVVPFIVWVHRYSDRLGFEDVPMIDDLYDDRVALADGACLGLATVAVLVAAIAPVPTGSSLLAGVLAFVGAALFAGNLLGVLVEHGPQSLPVLVGGRFVEESES
ncbi:MULTISPECIES: hypothetical protein [Haloarcula]|uniref:Uncharacterized protein n=1 Tax=Haloarcula pellucida TaxID=1427151 RepID=A0A830GLZ8_9EURY|nr:MULTISPECIES: hypothetical protein [Halomicroarcula]MBX0347962.1 hypothetical protein [Halomicroarcula pellucida]MDS0279919.1 hypothetical protein [Halomicroarcula sp. S1AR25-4]GGN96245.1 hypothetical protein GCM10009030_24350 [Halomicroarcula pellucida]